MKTQKLFTFIVLTLTVASCVFAQQYMTLEELRNMNKKKKTEKTEVKKDIPKDAEFPAKPGMTVELKEAETLAEGSNSNIEKPFIFIARTKEDFAKINQLIEGFSIDKEIDFKKQAVIATFAGMKNTGGYSINIYNMQGRTNVLIKNPPKDAMVTQAITYPYKVALINIDEEESFDIAVSNDFEKEMKTYQIKEAKFEFEGGFIGRQTKFEASGIIKVFRYQDLITFAFELKGNEKESNRILSEMGSGSLAGNSVNLARIEAGSFIDRPHPPLNVNVQFVENKMTMEFEPGKRDYIVNDGFVGRGSLLAELK